MSIFLDFDGTITTEDTVTHLANFALRFQSERRQQRQNIITRDSTTTQAGDAAGATPLPEASQGHDEKEVNANEEGNRHGGDDEGNSSSSSISSRWDDVVHAYISDYKSHVSSYAPGADDRLCADDEIAFLRSQKHVETRSLRRINACALFRGISRETFRAAGRGLVRDGTVRLRPGFAEFVRRALDKGWRVNVVSVNWSAAFIDGACGFDEGEICVFANEVREHDGVVLGPGVLAGDALLVNEKEEKEDEDAQAGRNLTNSCDKRDAVREVLRLHDALDKPFFYFGDSTTDMECLLEAARGVVIADDENSTLIQTLRRIGRKVPHVRDAEAGEELVWASNFEETIGVHV
ncbi:haloacid dehalogenase-like hydrolase-domain-containing protein [Xylaria sp. FL0064]|nr:haloacid dehalogenase-like hydrolase-domain-containing protein [Xylaria sp. FL0064]